MIRTSSLRLYFKQQAGGLFLIKSEASIAAPYPTADLRMRKGVTGCWIQLEDDSGKTIYRLDAPGLQAYISNLDNNSGETFYVLVPNLPKAKTVAIFSPPVYANGQIPMFGEESVLFKRFPIFASELLNSSTETAVTLPCDICGDKKGMVLEIVKAIYHDRVNNIHNLILLGDRFCENEQDKFVRNACECANFLISRPPYNTLYGQGSLNIFLVKVATYNKSSPYFNTSFSEGSTRITWCKENVKKVCDALFQSEEKTFWNWAGIIVNHEKYRIGTSDDPRNLVSQQFAAGLYNSSNGDHVRTFQHEYGHAAFKLLDEYSNAGAGRYSDGEPNICNVTTSLDREHLKWKYFLTPNVALPTTDSSASVVGCYVGGLTYESGIYHPQKYCVMNNQDKINGYFCKVCSYNAEIITANVGVWISLPSPGSLLYSPINNEWNNLSIAADIIEKYNCIPYTGKRFDDVVAELTALGGNGLENTRSAFLTVSGRAIVLPPAEKLVVTQGFYNILSGDNRGLWYISVPESGDMYYMFCSEAGNMIGVGKVKLPALPEATLFDGFSMGLERFYFCGDNGKLAYAKQDRYGNIEKNFELQRVKNLDEDSGITDLSVSYKEPLVIVSVVDNARVKIALYSSISEKWDDKGFVTMPCDQQTAYTSVRISPLGNTVYVAAQSESGKVLFREFNYTTLNWSEISHDAAENADQYDICSNDSCVIILLRVGSEVFIRRYNIIAEKWDAPVNISAKLGLTGADIITSLNGELIGNILHIVCLINQDAKHAMYNIAFETMESAFADILPLKSLHGKIGTMTLHSDMANLHMTLSSLKVHEDFSALTDIARF